MIRCTHWFTSTLHVADCEWRTVRWLVVTAAIFAATACSASVKEEDRQRSSIDDELIENLGVNPLEDIDRELFDWDWRQRGDEGLPDEDLHDRWRRELGEAAVAEDGNPLVGIAQRMRETGRQIGRHESGPPTQTAQEQIVADLDALIRQARKACGKCSPSDKQAQGVRSRRSIAPPGAKQCDGNGKPGDGSGTAGQRRSPGRGDARKVDMGQMEQLIKRLWGELPPSQREQMLQRPIEEFLPKYEWLTEEYFRRLSEEKQPGE